MNYIRHLNAVMRRFSVDERLNPTHVSLYMALFQFWNLSHFSEVIHINREEVMKMSKIGSMSTYHRCLKHLHSWSYIIYLPTHNPFQSSQVRFLKFGTTSETSNGVSSGEGTERASVSNIKELKQKRNGLKKPPTKEGVIHFFFEKDWSLNEAEKFFHHYEGVGWKLGGKVAILNWKSVAEKWVLKADELEIRPIARNSSTSGEHLKTSNIKNYGKPL